MRQNVPPIWCCAPKLPLPVRRFWILAEQNMALLQTLCFRSLPQSMNRPRQPRQDAVSGQPSPLTSMWRSVYKFLAARQALFQANAGAQRLHERFSFRKSVRLFLNIKSVLEKGLAGCLEFIQAGNKGVKGEGCPDTAFCRGCRGRLDCGKPS